MQTPSRAKSIYLKQCPRCCGDIEAASDQYGRYIPCLQCGYMADIGRPDPAVPSLQSLLRDMRDIVA